jgi:hypothetical protein
MVKRDAGPEALPASSQYIVVANLNTSANAPVAQNARLVIHRDDQRRIVMPARRQPLRKPRLGYAFQTRHRFQLAVARVLLASAWAGMVGHQHLD